MVRPQITSISGVANLHTVPDNRIGYLSSGLFAGMMIGAIGWGSCTTVVPHLRSLTHFTLQALIYLGEALLSISRYSLQLCLDYLPV